jgi:hypothetical protein
MLKRGGWLTGFVLMILALFGAGTSFAKDRDLSKIFEETSGGSDLTATTFHPHPAFPLAGEGMAFEKSETALSKSPLTMQAIPR